VALLEELEAEHAALPDLPPWPVGPSWMPLIAAR
jgi:hypothetical protein